MTNKIFESENTKPMYFHDEIILLQLYLPTQYLNYIINFNMIFLELLELMKKWRLVPLNPVNQSHSASSRQSWNTATKHNFLLVWYPEILVINSNHTMIPCSSKFSDLSVSTSVMKSRLKHHLFQNIWYNKWVDGLQNLGFQTEI